MAGLLKKLPPRATRKGDAAAVKKATKAVAAMPTIKGGKGLYERIANIVAIVNTKLGKYADKYELLRDDKSVEDYFNDIIQYGRAAIDTETDSLDPITTTLAGICVYVPGRKAAYIPINHISYVTGVKSANQVSIDVVKKCLQRCEEAGVEWVYHTAKFDIRVISNQVGCKLQAFWDTQLAASCLNENESHKLKDLHLKYCDSMDNESLTYDKLFEGIPFTYIPITTAYLYAAGDPIKTWELMEFQMQYLTPEKLPGPWFVFHNIEMPIIQVVAAMEDRGICLDTEFAQQLSEKYHAQLEEREKRIYEVLDMYKPEIDEYRKTHPANILSDPIGIGSAKQIAVVLYDILGLKSPDKEKPRGTGEEILVRLDTPISQALLDYRETAKLLSTYVDKMPGILNSKTGKIHCKFHQYGAATGRFSSSDPNMQNIPSHNKEIRKMFRGQPGFVLISSDFSQQEPRTLAHMSGDEHMIQAYIDGKDIYAWIAEKIYNVPYDECKEFRPDGTKNPEGKKRRDSVKSIILGIMYGRGAKAIAEQLNCSVKEAQKIIDQFFQAFPKVKKWMDSILQGAKAHGYVETAWGRKRRLPDVQLPKYDFQLLSGGPSTFDPLNFEIDQGEASVDPSIVNKYTKLLDKTWGAKQKRDIMAKAREEGIKITDNGGKIADAERQCVNSVIQGSSADMTKLAMIAIHNNERLKELDCHLLLQVHDEVICECPRENAKEVSELLTSLMVGAASSKIRVPMKCDAEITEVWYGDVVEVS